MSYKILIVDDSKFHREHLASVVESISGARAYRTASGFEALMLLPRHQFDLIITDINMPDINGLELINFVKRNPNYRSTPLFVVTGERGERRREQGLALGATEYVLKPVEPSNLADLLRRYLKIA